MRVDDEPYVPRTEVNTALAANKNAPLITKNVAGPPVYYPPGKELFAKSEAQAALRARVRIIFDFCQRKIELNFFFFTSKC